MSVLRSLVRTLRVSLRSRAALQLEIIALRHQLHVLERSRPARVPLRRSDRCSGVVVASGRGGVTRIVIVKPETVVRLARQLFRRAWAQRAGTSADRRCRPTFDPDPFDVGGRIRCGVLGEPRRALKLGIDAQSIYGREVHGPTAKPPSRDVAYLPRQPCDATDGGGLLGRADGDVPLSFVLVILAHDRRRRGSHRGDGTSERRVDRPAVPRGVPLGSSADFYPRSGSRVPTRGRTVKGMGPEEMLTCPASTWKNAYANGSLARSPRMPGPCHRVKRRRPPQILKLYVTYYSELRTRLAREGRAATAADVPDGHRTDCRGSEVGGLHHRYDRRAA